MTALDTKALAEQAWRDLEIAADATGALEVARLTLPVEKVRALVAEHRLSPSQGEGAAADVVERTSNPGERREIQFHLDRLNAWLTELWAANNLTLHMCNGTVRTGLHGLLCDIRDDVMAVRAALASIAPRGEKRHVGVSERVTDADLTARLKEIAVEVFPSANKFAVAEGVKNIIRILESIEPSEYAVLHRSMFPFSYDQADDGQPDEAQEWHDYDPDC